MGTTVHNATAVTAILLLWMHAPQSLGHEPLRILNTSDVTYLTRVLGCVNNLWSTTSVLSRMIPWSMLVQKFIKEKSLSMRGIVAIYPANCVGDDIEVYANEDRGLPTHKFFGLRQQAEKENESEAYMCLSDFIAPKESGVPDYLGLFANATFGVEELVETCKKEVNLNLPRSFPFIPS